MSDINLYTYAAIDTLENIFEKMRQSASSLFCQEDSKVATEFNSKFQNDLDTVFTYLNTATKILPKGRFNFEWKYSDSQNLFTLPASWELTVTLSGKRFFHFVGKKTSRNNNPVYENKISFAVGDAESTPAPYPSPTVFAPIQNLHTAGDMMPAMSEPPPWPLSRSLFNPTPSIPNSLTNFVERYKDILSGIGLSISTLNLDSIHPWFRSCEDQLNGLAKLKNGEKVENSVILKDTTLLLNAYFKDKVGHEFIEFNRRESELFKKCVPSIISRIIELNFDLEDFGKDIRFES